MAFNAFSIKPLVDKLVAVARWKGLFLNSQFQTENVIKFEEHRS